MMQQKQFRIGFLCFQKKEQTPVFFKKKKRIKKKQKTQVDCVS